MSEQNQEDGIGIRSTEPVLTLQAFTQNTEVLRVTAEGVVVIQPGRHREEVMKYLLLAKEYFANMDPQSETAKRMQPGAVETARLSIQMNIDNRLKDPNE